ncbi:MAG: VacJ family lipoprotein [Candidatus Thiodiazotropha sp. DIVDIV]
MLKRIIALFIPLLILSGCATFQSQHPADPIESFNRKSDQFNQDFDRAVAKPIAQGYRYVTPSVIDLGVTNFFRNLSDIPSAANNLLQLKPGRALSDIGRVCINSTLGIFGLFDVASDMGIPSYKEDMGQTLGYWGMGDTPYLVIPLLGPTTLRDLLGRVGDTIINPISYPSQSAYLTLSTLQLVDIRADLLEAGNVLDEAAVDRYAFLREFYLQQRQSMIMDGPNHMDDDELFDESLFEDEQLFEESQ